MCWTEQQAEQTSQKKNHVDAKFDSIMNQLVQKSGDRMSGNLNMQRTDIAGLANSTRPFRAVNKQ